MTQPEIEQEIEQTRERLGQTVEELVAKADLRARARDKATELSGRVRQSQIMPLRWPLAVATAGLVIVASGLFWRRRTGGQIPLVRGQRDAAGR